MAKPKRKLKPRPRRRRSNTDTSPLKLRMAKTKQKVKPTPERRLSNTDTSLLNLRTDNTEQNRDPTPRRCLPSTESRLLNLPTEVVVLIVESSDAVDRYRIMLLCRHLYSLIKDQKLLKDITPDERRRDLVHFLLQLEAERVPAKFNLCSFCIKLQPLDEEYWFGLSENEYGARHSMGLWCVGRGGCERCGDRTMGIVAWCRDTQAGELRKCPTCQLPDFRWPLYDYEVLLEEEIYGTGRASDRLGYP